MPYDSSLLYQPRFASAVANIQRRAERQTDISKLEDVFVTSDLMTRAATTDTQLVLGRRGTGKTHMLRVFQLRKQQAGELVYYFDCTRLGSGYASLRADPDVIAKKYFISLLNDVGSQLLDTAIRMEMPALGVQERVLD